MAPSLLRGLGTRTPAARQPVRAVLLHARAAQPITESATATPDAPSEDVNTGSKGLRRLAKLAERTPAAADAPAPAPTAVAPAAPSTRASSRVQSASAASTSAPSDQDPKAQEALNATLAKLNKKFGAGTISSFRERAVTVPQMERVSTGVLTLDNILGGGIPLGRLVEIFGPESSGKTSLALCVLAEAQRQVPGRRVAMIDAEHAFDAAYAANLGLDVDPLFFSTPDTGEDALEIVDELCRSGACSVILVDSVSALIPRMEMERDMGDPQVGSQARLMSNGLKRIAQSAARFNTTVIFINQIRMKIGVIYGNPETTSGGMALKYYASQRIDVRKSKHLDGTDKDGPANGLKIKAKVVKNKVGPPAGIVLFDVIFAKGVDRMGCVVDAGVAVGTVERRGAHHYFVHGGKEVKLGNGRDKSIQFLEDPENAEVRAALEAQTRERLTPGQGLPDALSSQDDAV